MLVYIDFVSSEISDQAYIAFLFGMKTHIEGIHMSDVWNSVGLHEHNVYWQRNAHIGCMQEAKQTN